MSCHPSIQSTEWDLQFFQFMWLQSSSLKVQKWKNNVKTSCLPREKRRTAAMWQSLRTQEPRHLSICISGISAPSSQLWSRALTHRARATAGGDHSAEHRGRARANPQLPHSRHSLWTSAGAFIDTGRQKDKNNHRECYNKTTNKGFDNCG